MSIIETKTGDKIDMEQETGNKNAVVGVFKSANGYHVHCSIDDFCNGGYPIEYEGESEGEDMEFVGVGFLV